ncbi:MAG: hypothetical protein GWN58_40350, partial [Anaerolineae bacterium]|nr:hypothetical protein [Anaerolineae bacterium]
GVLKFMDNLLVWVVLAALLVLVAYLPTLIDQFLNQVPIQGAKLW